MRPEQSSSRLYISPAPGVFACTRFKVSEWCTGIPVLVRWAAIAVFHMAAVGFAFAFCFCVCLCSV